MHPLILLILLVAVLLFISWLKRAPPAARTNAIILAGVAVLLLLTVTGRAHWLFPAIGAAVALFHRVMAVSRLVNMFKSMKGPSPGRSSDIETEFIHMSLNHDTGELDGEVLKGKQRGRKLSTLSLEELLELHKACSSDAQSSALLEAFLDRYHEGAWRERVDPDRRAPSRANGSLTREDACQILGVPTDASVEQIVEAHRRLMQRVHPDRGGSAYLASQLNQAKEVLLKSASSRSG